MFDGLVIELVIALIGGGGLVSAIVAFLKYRPDVNSAAVIDAHTTLKGMRELNDEMRQRLDDVRADLVACEDKLRVVADERDELEERLRRAERLLRAHGMI